MTLPAGTSLGPYQILAAIGAGGMGEVYRAHDPRLGREVAIKVLPPSFSGDPDRLRRFEQEARAAGALNHPNVLAVHDVGTCDRTPYVVSELLEGETLGTKMAGSSLPLRKCLDYAIQIARGLAAAHGKGIVHRDLKPENLFVTNDGRVKILDLGLAKLSSPERQGASEEATLSTPSQTTPGMILGTVGYMSPEQVGGLGADHRSDIFSFGTIFYEMLFGRRAFKGETSAETMFTILRKDPLEAPGTERVLPLGVVRILRHCLEKNPDERFQSAKDLAFALDALVLEALLGVSDTSAAEAPTRGRRRALRTIAGVAVLMLAAIVGFLAGPREVRRLKPSFTQLTLRRGTVWSARFAPDGQTIVYAASWDSEPVQLFAARLGSPESRPLGLSPATLLSISTRGEMALLLRPRWPFTYLRRGLLARGDLAGGAPRELLGDVHGADWSPGGTELAIVRRLGGKDRLEFPIGKMLYETSGTLHHPRISPRGDWIALFERLSNLSRLIVISPDGKRKVLSEGWEIWSRGVAWPPSGDDVWFTGARGGGDALRLYAVSLDGEEHVVANVPESLELFDIGHDGRVLLAHGLQRRVTLGLRPGTREEQVLSSLEESFLHDLAADGTAILFNDPDGVRFRRTDGSPSIRLAHAAGWLPWGALSPDSRWVLTKLSRSPDSPPMIIPTGVGEPRQLGGLRNVEWAGWLPGGRVAYAVRTATGDELYAHDPTTGGSRAIASRPPSSLSLGENGPRISPDGRWLAATTSTEISIHPVEGGALRLVPGNHDGWTLIGWSSEGAWLYAYRIGDVPAQVVRINIATGERQAWREIVPADRAGLWRIHPIRVTPDGRAYAYTYTRHLSSLYLAEGLQ
jgi:Tol biopolymer transport system component